MARIRTAILAATTLSLVCLAVFFAYSASSNTDNEGKVYLKREMSHKTVKHMTNDDENNLAENEGLALPKEEA